jgi:hypothetical protein
MLSALLAATARGRRVPRNGFNRLTTKNGPRDYYKGKGAQPPGFHTRKGARPRGPFRRDLFLSSHDFVLFN